MVAVAKGTYWMTDRCHHHVLVTVVIVVSDDGDRDGEDILGNQQTSSSCPCGGRSGRRCGGGCQCQCHCLAGCKGGGS